MPVYNQYLLRRQLERHEGKRHTPYVDSLGNLTVGIGHLQSKRISDVVLEQLYADDVRDCELGLDAVLPWWRSLDDVRQRVLLDMAFNMGCSTLLTFEKTLEAVRTGNFGRAADQMLLSAWASQVGDRAKRLAAMIRTGADQL